MLNRLSAVSFVFLVGCGGPSIENLCARACDCDAECDAAEEAECIAEGEELEQAAEDAGCTEAFNDFLACVDDTLVCENGDVDSAESCQEFLGACQR